MLSSISLSIPILNVSTANNISQSLWISWIHHRNIAIVFKHVPVHGQASRTEALAAECAVEQGGNPSFFQLSKALFRYSQSDGHGLSAPLDQIARETGLDPNRLLECINAAGRPAR